MYHLYIPNTQSLLCHPRWNSKLVTAATNASIVSIIDVIMQSTSLNDNCDKLVAT